MSKTFGLKFQSRVLRPFFGSDKSAWIAATNSLREENEIRVVEYDEKSDTLTSPVVYVHANEVWDVALSPNEATKLLTAYNLGSSVGVTLWKVEEGQDLLQKVCDVGEHETAVKRIQWHEQTNILTLEDTRIRAWDVQEDAAKEVMTGVGQELDQFSNLHVSNADPHTLYITNGQGYQIWDVRDMKMQQSLNHCHDMPLRNIDDAEHQIATCGDDCTVKLWDNRNLTKTLMELSGHSHWVWDCAFNKTYSSLLLTASSDGSVILWDVSQSADSASSPTSIMSDEKKVCTYTDHDESVYGVCWSLKDDWSFASLSYDGQFALNKVPSDVKYRLLI